MFLSKKMAELERSHNELEKLNYTLNNIIEFFKVFNTNEEALNIVQNKSDKTKNSKSLLAALKHLI